MYNCRFNCPKCKSSLIYNSNGYFCNQCEKLYPVHDGFVDFLENSDFYAGEVAKRDMQGLLHNIDTIGYDNALTRFFEKYPRLQKYITDYWRADWVSHCINNNNLRCLDLGSGLGTLSETLSDMYKEVYSLEAVEERVRFQIKRFENKKRNIQIIRGNALELPFPDCYFDLIVCNGVLEWIGMLNKNLPPRQAQLIFLREMRRVLSDRGCLYVGIENRFGLQAFRGAKDHSGLPYTSLLPRSVASVLVRKFGPSGGIYGDKSKSEKEKTGYYTYTYSISGYRSLFNDAGFNFKSYWVYPSYVDPFYSGNISDKIAIKGFFRYLQSTNRYRSKFKIILSLIEKLDKSILTLLTQLFVPCFLFYCYKTDIPETFEDRIAKYSSYTNLTTFSGDIDIGYVLYNVKARPSKIARLRRYGYDLPPSDIPVFNKTVPGVKPTERAWIEDWIEGRTINPLDLHESHAAIKWLIEFQKKTRSSRPMSELDIKLEVDAVRSGLSKLPDMETAINRKYVTDYESYLQANSLHKVSEHGDFFHSNILFDPKSDKITVIDWNYFRKEGDPFFDFVFFIISAMQLNTGRDSTLKEFGTNLQGSGKFSETLPQLQETINDYFGFKVDMQTLIPYTLLRYIVRKQYDRGQNEKIVIDFKNLLKMLNP